MIQNIWAIGRNYVEHAKELGNEVPTEPLVFLKAGSCATLAASEIHLPKWATDVHHEVEIALQFDENLQISAACVALDLTERTLQSKLKSKGQPWTLAKSFTEACPISKFFPVKNLDELRNIDIKLMVNGELRQNGNTSLMIFSYEEQLDYVRQHFPVSPGDLLLTGTPAGVGPVKPGDVLVAEIVGKITHKWTVK
ncbi:fumarylacetoacetate hydrolase family protein [Bdellovibrio sp. SKB1291214]|uniref:fumarylacetoacetate hydrolase family protein n=1 Tax=Bdellovibrio sp. SKB1291214 TaxID=1732569 RepID=UPI000B5175BB|nr:fumarylacetoacetate hydrolase family protein [Bdellovibrio sp. SKB1291214]UYL09570.1 fumarylacetoacetate hydrolase family protein [Bdellovibrio sp. SKB1291214]